ncbi:hypothetical protein UY3_01630 [Chelonia mydas]|uniref:Myb/SANT-like DNA-binding domain-containing protein n=1 Tax=Chelonia mydas TaxID=8469 RepID=M7BZ16_CHEMY|nr:hypothetical protein UY3_01630 [Chelonia mydas]
MRDRRYSRDATQCRVKLKELRQAYQKTKESNGRSRTEPQTCYFYTELHAILEGVATTTPPLSVDSDDGVLSAMAEDFADGEDDKEEDELEESTQHTVLPNSQDLFLTLTEIPSQPNQAREGTSGVNVSGDGAEILQGHLHEALLDVLPKPLQKVSGEGSLIPCKVGHFTTAGQKHVVWNHCITKHGSVWSWCLLAFKQHPFFISLCYPQE